MRDLARSDEDFCPACDSEGESDGSGTGSSSDDDCSNGASKCNDTEDEDDVVEESKGDAGDYFQELCCPFRIYCDSHEVCQATC